MRLDFNKIIGYFIYRNDRFLFIKLARDWKVMLLIFFVIFVLVTAAGVYIFWGFQKDSFVKKDDFAGEEKGLIILKKEQLNSVLGELKRREENFTKNLNAPSVQDPSL